MRTSKRMLALAGVALALSGSATPSWAQGKAAPPADKPPDAMTKQVPSVAPLPGSGTVSDWRASKLIGTTMTNIFDESVGTVSDVVIDADGKVVAVLVSVGGFLGLGETTVAIGLRHLVISHADPDRLTVKTSLSRKAIEQAASLEPGHASPAEAR